VPGGGAGRGRKTGSWEGIKINIQFIKLLNLFMKNLKIDNMKMKMALIIL